VQAGDRQDVVQAGPTQGPVERRVHLAPVTQPEALKQGSGPSGRSGLDRHQGRPEPFPSGVEPPEDGRSGPLDPEERRLFQPEATVKASGHHGHRPIGAGVPVG